MSAVFTLRNDGKGEPPAEPHRCPQCGDQITESLGPVNSSLDWFRCVLCRHIWTSRPVDNGRRLRTED